MKNIIKATLIASLLAAAPLAIAPASAASIGVHVGPIGVGIGNRSHHRRHQVCEYRHHHRTCFWR